MRCLPYGRRQGVHLHSSRMRATLWLWPWLLSCLLSSVVANQALPQDASRRRVLDILADLSAHHTANCTTSAQDIYQEQAKKRYEVLYGHEGRKGTFSNSASSSKAHSHRYFIAINLYNSFEIIPDLLSTMTKVVNLLGINNCFISIYENGSSDQTKAILHLFEVLAESIGLRMSIRTSSRSRSSFSHRIEYLAEVRNAALAPLHRLRQETGEIFDSVIFMNDVLPCVDDIMELILQSRRQNAAITCGSDYIFLEKVNGPVFYDNWVSRDINGTALNNEPFQNVVVDAIGKERFMQHLPLQMQACWNGIVILDPAPLYQLHPVRFRMANAMRGECSASECSLLSNDYWHAGHGRIVMVPRVKLTYDSKTFHLVHPHRGDTRQLRNYLILGEKGTDVYHDPQDQQWYGPHDRPFTTAEDELIEFVEGPEHVWCWGWTGAGYLSGPDSDPVWEDVPLPAKDPLAIWHDRTV